MPTGEPAAMSYRNNGENSEPGSRQWGLNRAVYGSPGVYRRYISETLYPPEIACLLKYQPHIAGRDVLDVGVGAGRTTRYLAPLARRYEAVDFSPVMVRYMKTTMPEISTRQADFRDLSDFEDASFDFVFAPSNVVDTLSHEDRLQALSEAHRVLRPGGVLAIASHNVQHSRAFSGPQLFWCADPVRLAYRFAEYLLCWWNYLRLRRLRKTTPEYAVINDNGHYFALLHYYVSRRAMQSQLESLRFRLEEVFDTLGRLAHQHADDSENPSLLYVARRYDAQPSLWTT
jgi:SAM-dependent methyltransferase